MSSHIAPDDLRDIKACGSIFADPDSVKVHCDSSISNLEFGAALDLDPEDYVPVNRICDAAKSLIAAWQALNRSDSSSNAKAPQSQYVQIDVLEAEQPPR